MCSNVFEEPDDPIYKVEDSGSTPLQYVLPIYKITWCYIQENCILIATAVRTAAVKCATYPLQNRKIPGSNLGSEIRYKCSGEMLCLDFGRNTVCPHCSIPFFFYSPSRQRLW
jgi:hypothetical protein